jgi:hypothetical protein
VAFCELIRQTLEKEKESPMRQYISYSQPSRKPMILIEFGVPMKLARLNKMCLNERCNRVRMGKHFIFKTVIKQGDALSLLPFNLALGYIKKTNSVV